MGSGVIFGSMGNVLRHTGTPLLSRQVIDLLIRSHVVLL